MEYLGCLWMHMVAYVYVCGYLWVGWALEAVHSKPSIAAHRQHRWQTSSNSSEGDYSIVRCSRLQPPSASLDSFKLEDGELVKLLTRDSRPYRHSLQGNEGRQFSVFDDGCKEHRLKASTQCSVQLGLPRVLRGPLTSSMVTIPSDDGPCSALISFLLNGAARSASSPWKRT